MLQGSAGRVISKEEGDISLIPSSTAMAWTVVVERASVDCLCALLQAVECFFAG